MVAQQSPKLKERVRFLPPVPILVWPSLVRRLLWVQEIAGSNPATKTNGELAERFNALVLKTSEG